MDSAHLITIFLVDDHEVVRHGLRALFDAQPGLRVVGEAATVREATDRLPTCRPDVAVVDLQLPDGNGADICRFIRDHLPDTACLVLTSFAQDEALLAAVRSGASGYALKQIRSGELIESVRRLAAGETLVDEHTRRRLRERALADTWDPLLATLTAQERALLAHLAAGLTNRQIAERMHLSDKTVKNYVSSLLSKLGVSRRSAAAAYHVKSEARRDISMAPTDRHGAVRY